MGRVVSGGTRRSAANAVVVALAVVAGGVVVAGTALGGSAGPAAAAGLTAFEGCAEAEAWFSGTAAGSGRLVEESALSEGDAGPAPLATGEAAGALAAADDASTGSTNVQVDGVDELDVVDGDGTRLLVAGADVDSTDPAGGATLSLVDPAAGFVLGELPVAGWDPRVTWDTAAGVAWVVAGGYGVEADGYRSSVLVHRVQVGEAELVLDGTWQVSGWLVSARRVDDRLHVVASDQAMSALPGLPVAGTADGGGSGPTTLPFVGDDGAPVVPCDEVLRPVAGSEVVHDPGATLVATLDAASAEVAPVATVEVAGSGGLVGATTDALYVATPTWGEVVETGIHRFDLGDLTLTGSGTVPGTPLSQFALDEHEGVLRVATTLDAGFGGIGPMPVEPDDGAGSSDPAVLPPGPPPVPQVDNLVTTLDTEGDLDQVGQLRSLGKPGESIEGVRFDGDVAYVVTFLRTDPLYVLDLSDSATPVATGELEVPGFSAYLHPVGDGLVLGVGMAGTPDGALTGAQAQLFDVADPAAPSVVDDEPLGDESEAVWDHHAFAVLGDGLFAVPAARYGFADGEPIAGPELEVVVMRPTAAGIEVVERLDVSAVAGGAGVYRTRTLTLDGGSRAVATDGGVAVFAPGGGLERWIELR